MAASHVNDVPSLRIESQLPARGSAFARWRVPVHIDAVFDNFDAAAGETVHVVETPGTEGADGIDGVGQPIQHQAVNGFTQRLDWIGVVPAVLRQYQARPHS